MAGIRSAFTLFKTFAAAPPKQNLPRFGFVACAMAVRNISTIEVTKNITLISNDKKNCKIVDLKLEVPEKKPLVVMLSWLMARKKHIIKYADLYLKRGYDVMNISISPWQLLWPVKGTQRPNKILTFLGLQPASGKFRKFLIAYLYCPLIALLLSMVFFEITTNSRDALYKIDLCESLVSLSYNGTRVLTFLYAKVLIKEILDLRSSFWTDENFGLPVKTKQEFSFYYQMSNLLMTSGFVSLVFMCLLIFTPEQAMPLAIYTPENFPITVVIYVAEAITLIVLVLLVSSCDVFFVFLSLELTDQFRRLISLVSTIEFGKDTDEVNWKKLKVCVKHQNLLWSFHRKTNQAFSAFFVSQYFLCIAEGCIQVLGATTLFDRPIRAVRSIALFNCTIVLISFIFFPACGLAEEGEQLAQAFYNIDFQNSKNTRIRKDLMFIIMGSQRSLEMSGGGMFKLNKPQYLKLFQMMYSISMLLASVKM